MNVILRLISTTLMPPCTIWSMPELQILTLMQPVESEYSPFNHYCLLCGDGCIQRISSVIYLCGRSWCVMDRIDVRLIATARTI